MNDLATIRIKCSRALSRYQTARSVAKREKAAVIAFNRNVGHCQQAQVIVQTAGQFVQEQVHKQIARVVSRCLKTVFGKDACSFRIRFERKRGKTDAILEFGKDGEWFDPLSESMGGQVDIAALALRLACLLLVRPKARRILILDEPMRNVNGEVYQSRVGGLLLDLAKEMNVQFIIVTDDDWLRIGKVIQF